MDDVILRRARPGEAQDVTALALRSKAYWGYDDEFMAACVDELTVSAAEIRSYPTFMLELEGRLAGFTMFKPGEDGQVELAFLFVEPAFIGRGLGRRLVEHAKKLAQDTGSQAMIIEGDPNAGPFYRAMGGVQIGTRPSSSIPGRELPLFRIDLPK